MPLTSLFSRVCHVFRISAAAGPCKVGAGIAGAAAGAAGAAGTAAGAASGAWK